MSVFQTSKSQQPEHKEKVGKTNQKKPKENMPSNKRKGQKRLIKGYANHKWHYSFSKQLCTLLQIHRLCLRDSFQVVTLKLEAFCSTLAVI